MFDWCERNDVHYIVGLARNRVLEREVEVACEVAKDGFEATGAKSRVFSEFDYAAGTWRRSRRVIARIEHGPKGRNPRFIVTNLHGEARRLYEMGIPVKSITDSGEKPITDSGPTDHNSERSDAGVGLWAVVIGLGQRSVSFSHRFSFQVELVSAVHESVEDRIGQGRVADDGMPLFDRELAGDDGRA